MGLLIEELSVLASSVSNTPLQALFGLAIFLVVSQLLANGIRNIYFHPLSNIPGPKLAAFTELYYIYNFIKGSSHLTITSFHSKYGPVVRLGPNKVSFNTPQSWKDIYGGSTSRGSFPKSDFYEFSGVPNIVTTRNPKQHEVWKKVLAPAFSHKALAEQEPAVQEYIDLLIRQLDKHAAGAEGTDVAKWFTFAAFDIIGDMAFGAPFGVLESGKTHFWVKRVTDGANAGIFRGTLVKLFGSTGVGGRLATWFTPQKERDARTSNFAFCREQVAKRIDSKTPRRDFFTPIVNGPEGPTMDLETLVSQSFSFAIAGSETSSSFLSIVTYHLARNPLILKRLATELHHTFPTYESINNVDAAAKCLMLRAVINEAFRIQPPVPCGLPRVSPGENVGGVYIPAGIEVFTHSYAATHSPHNFVDPEKFAPERWLGGGVYADDKKDASQPFSVGSRACLGINLAKLETRLILAKLVWVFDIALVEPEFEWDSACTSSLLWAKPPLLVKLTRREGFTVPPIDDLQ